MKTGRGLRPPGLSMGSRGFIVLRPATIPCRASSRPLRTLDALANLQQAEGRPEERAAPIGHRPPAPVLIEFTAEVFRHPGRGGDETPAPGTCPPRAQPPAAAKVESPWARPPSRGTSGNARPASRGSAPSRRPGRKDSCPVPPRSGSVGSAPPQVVPPPIRPGAPVLTCRLDAHRKHCRSGSRRRPPSGGSRRGALERRLGRRLAKRVRRSCPRPATSGAHGRAVPGSEGPRPKSSDRA